MCEPDAPIGVYTQLSFGAEEKEGIVVVSASFRFESENKTAPFIILETKAYFQIKSESWKSMYDAETNALTLEKGFARHISVITVGTSRGILHCRTEGTDMNHLILPLINIEKILSEDIVINIENIH
ncbi:MAG TPA: hypothetical protein DCS09_08275 [Porphyromonadaceae bacterium]|nr:hypothetical protein [Porphyromonadaceae bacterium]